MKCWLINFQLFQLKTLLMRKIGVAGKALQKDLGKKYVYIGITHSPLTQNTKNIKLDKNPNPMDQKEAYFRARAAEASISKFKSKKKDWQLLTSDKKKADKIVEKSKKKKR